MSYTSGPFNYEGESPTEQYKRQRRTVNVNLWQTGSSANAANTGNETTTTTHRCPVCKVKLIAQEGGRLMFCKECGSKTPTAELKKEGMITGMFGRSNSMLSTKGSGTIIVSKEDDRNSTTTRKKKSLKDFDSINSQLDAEELAMLRQSGFQI